MTRGPLIENHTLLSDLSSIAIVSPEGTISWWCAPNADDPSVFGDLVGGPSAGGCWIRPAAPSVEEQPFQSYVGDTLILQTQWPSGVVVTDYLDRSNILVDDGPRTLIRSIVASVPTVVEIYVRPDYARATTTLDANDEGYVVRSTSQAVAIRMPEAEFTLIDDNGGSRLVATLTPREAPYVLELRHGTDNCGPHLDNETERRRLTAFLWSSWASQLNVDRESPYDLVRSALTLKALCNDIHGGVIAAATTSLPEWIGGERNWDYRYCWLRDGSMTVEALVKCGSTTEAVAFLGWLTRVLATIDDIGSVRPLYTVKGLHLPPEESLEHLSGYEGSKPVRIGNAADAQVQLDVFGPITDLIWTLTKIGFQLTPDIHTLLQQIANMTLKFWREPDHGFWELRTEPKQLVHSKLMGWSSLDRIIKIYEFLGRDKPKPWNIVRDEIAAEVLTRGWDEAQQTFTMEFGEPALDALSLWIGLTGLVEGNDPRFISTVNVIDRELRNKSRVMRYTFNDGLEGEEGGFLICAAWLAESFLLIGEKERAKELLDQIDATKGNTGLLAEQFDPKTQRGLGNHPQAFSHIGLMRVAQLL